MHASTNHDIMRCSHLYIIILANGGSWFGMSYAEATVRVAFVCFAAAR
jgi:hypothetical protein